MAETDYIAFGDEWKKEMMKFPKAELIKMLRAVKFDLMVLHNDDGNPIDLPRVTRIEVIDDSGRAYVNHKKENRTMLSFQDEERTLKIFITTKK